MMQYFLISSIIIGAKRGALPLLAVATEQGCIHIINTSRRREWDFGASNALSLDSLLILYIQNFREKSFSHTLMASSMSNGIILTTFSPHAPATKPRAFPA